LCGNHIPQLCNHSTWIRSNYTPKLRNQDIWLRGNHIPKLGNHSTSGLSWPWSCGSWIYNYLCNQCLSPLMLWVRISIRARCTTVFDKVCQWLAAGRWFSPDPQVSSIKKTDRHDITEILLKVALIAIKPNHNTSIRSNYTPILHNRDISLRGNYIPKLHNMGIW
jgi:hypothetical protein